MIFRNELLWLISVILLIVAPSIALFIAFKIDE